MPFKINKQTIKDILTVWFLVLTPIGLLSSSLKACSAFYSQVIYRGEQSIQLRITPDMFLPCECFDRSRAFCGFNSTCFSKNIHS